MTTFDDVDDLVGRDDAVADEPAAPGEPGHAEELDELAEIGDSLRPEGEELDDRPGPGGLPP
jgi:polyphosphate kinase